MAMVIVQGTFQLDPAERDAYVAETVETQRISRAEQGCIEYVVAPDPLDPGRAVLSERWETRADLEAHIAALVARRNDAPPPQVAVLSRVVAFYEAAEIADLP